MCTCSWLGKTERGLEGWEVGRQSLFLAVQYCLHP